MERFKPMQKLNEEERFMIFNRVVQFSIHAYLQREKGSSKTFLLIMSLRFKNNFQKKERFIRSFFCL